jgi:hypothetical protein
MTSRARQKATFPTPAAGLGTGTPGNTNFLRGDGQWTEIQLEPASTGSYLTSIKENAPSGYLDVNSAHSKTTYPVLFDIVGQRLDSSLITGSFVNIVYDNAATTIRGVANNANTWICVGGSGLLLRSTNNGESFTAIDPGVTITLNGVWYGDGRWVAVGGSGTVVYSTDDGATWTATTASYPISGSTNTIENVRFGNGVWVAVGSAGKCIRSTDGITWTEVEDAPGGTITALAFAEGIFVYGDDDGGIYTSTDGITRTLRVDRWGVESLDNIEEIAYLDGKFIAVGQNTRVMVSEDGITWGSMFQIDTVNLPLLRSITYNPQANVYVAWGTGLRAYVSIDLTTWYGPFAVSDTSSSVGRSLFANGVWVSAHVYAGPSGTVNAVSRITITDITSFNMETDFYVGSPSALDADWAKWYIKS